MMDVAKIFQEAKAAAQQAAEEENAKLPPENERGLDCGFAWVTIRPARGPFVSYLKANGLATRGAADGGSGISIWYSKVHTIQTQSISVHRAACVAFSDVLQRNGISASTGSRLD